MGFLFLEDIGLLSKVRQEENSGGIDQKLNGRAAKCTESCVSRRLVGH